MSGRIVTSHRVEMHMTEIGRNQTEKPLSRTTFSLACAQARTQTRGEREAVTIRFSISWVSRSTQCWASGGVISATAPPSAGHCVGDAHYTTSLTGLHSANTGARCVRITPPPHEMGLPISMWTGWLDGIIKQFFMHSDFRCMFLKHDIFIYQENIRFNIFPLPQSEQIIGDK